MTASFCRNCLATGWILFGRPQLTTAVCRFGRTIAQQCGSFVSTCPVPESFQIVACISIRRGWPEILHEFATRCKSAAATSRLLSPLLCLSLPLLSQQSLFWIGSSAFIYGPLGSTDFLMVSFWAWTEWWRAWWIFQESACRCKSQQQRLFRSTSSSMTQ